MRLSLKSIELAWRRMWIAAITAAIRRRSAGAPPDWESRRHRVLFLRHDRIGDMIVTSGVLRAIARSHPTIELDVLASPANAGVLRGASWIHDVVVFDKRKLGGYLRTLRQLRRARYDVVVDCMVTAPSLTTLLLMLASGAPQRIGIAGRGLESVLTVAVPPHEGAGHLIDHLARLAVPFGVDPGAADVHPEIVLSDDERKTAESRWGERGETTGGDAGRLLVNVSSGTPARRWPVARYVEAIGAARARWPRLTVLVIGTPEERDRAAAVAAQSGVRYVPTRGVREAFALVAASDVVLTPDTSIVHAAAAFRRPTVAMFLSAKHAYWVPYGTPSRVIAWPHDDLSDLPAKPVVAALLEHLAEHLPPRASGAGSSTTAERARPA